MPKESLEEFLNKNRGYKSQKAKDITAVSFNDYKTKKKPKLITVTTRKEFDFLKFYIIVEYYFLEVVFPDITNKEFKLLLFLYSEPPFTRTDFNDFCEMVHWNKGRLNSFIERDYISITKGRKTGKNGRNYNVQLFTVSRSAKKKISSFYNKLLLRYKVTERPEHNPLFRVNSRSYTNKRYAKKIRQMNAMRDKWMDGDKYPKVDGDFVYDNEYDFDKEAGSYIENINERLITMDESKEMSKRKGINKKKREEEKKKKKEKEATN